MRKLIVSEWMTLDGIFDAETMGEWFLPFDSIERQEYIKNGIMSCDTILLGRTTYELYASYWPQQKNDDMGPAGKLNNVAKVVVSATLKKVEWNNSTIISENIIGEITKLKQQPGNEIQIGGSATLVQLLMKSNLIDEYRFLIHPIIIGSGKRFFKDGMKTPGLKIVKTALLDKGVVLNCYQPL